jgi:hypothetical protein|uniref:hypothetical protein n=1 Tax=Lactococcus sp. TaxID=44273 RepID=UPI003241F4AA
MKVSLTTFYGSPFLASKVDNPSLLFNAKVTCAIERRMSASINNVFFPDCAQLVAKFAETVE